jgi:hypothetical protein
MEQYLLKAENEGIRLSWDRYESMASQDSLSSLGLYCFDCFQGPCLLNSLSREEERTICGLTKRDLVYRGLQRMISKYSDPFYEGDGLSCGCENMTSLVAQAQRYMMKRKNVMDTNPIAGGSIEAGLGVLKKDYLNICVEGFTPAGLRYLSEVVTELAGEVRNKGAKGCHIVLAGDVSPQFAYPSVSNSGGVELAILTGLIDLYLVGTDGLGLGQNVAPYYHTVVAQAGQGTCKHKIRTWLLQAIEAYSRRDQNKILASEQSGAVPFVQLDPKEVKHSIENGCIQGICILGGGSNIQVTQDLLLCEAAVKLKSKDVICLTYGNAAVTLGKYGYLEESGGENAVAYCIGAEDDIVKIIDTVQEAGKTRVVALYPELTTGRDLLAALTFAGMGIKVITAVKLPIYGDEYAHSEISDLIGYAEPSDYLDRVLKLFGY